MLDSPHRKVKYDIGDIASSHFCLSIKVSAPSFKQLACFQDRTSQLLSNLSWSMTNSVALLGVEGRILGEAVCEVVYREQYSY